MPFHRSLTLLALAAAVSSAPAFAGAVETGFATTSIGRGDDFATGALNLGFTANYFGTTRSTAFISNNGYITFNSGQSSFTPVGLGADYAGQPIIAAFYADVDTDVAPSGVAAYGTGTFGGRAAFGATWSDVGYFNNGTDKTNTFQILLVDRSDVTAGDFDIYLNYDRIQWETGNANGGNGGLGGASAAAGYNAGTGNADGTYYELPGSQVAGSFIDGGTNALATNSNVGVAGRYVFNVRNGAVTPGAGDVPEPATWGMMILGFGMVGAAARRRRGAAAIA